MSKIALERDRVISFSVTCRRSSFHSPRVINCAFSSDQREYLFSSRKEENRERSQGRKGERKKRKTVCLQEKRQLLSSKDDRGESSRSAVLKIRKAEETAQSVVSI